jgi:hypothetical protein
MSHLIFLAGEPKIFMKYGVLDPALASTHFRPYLHHAQKISPATECSSSSFPSLYHSSAQAVFLSSFGLRSYVWEETLFLLSNTECSFLRQHSFPSLYHEEQHGRLPGSAVLRLSHLFICIILLTYTTPLFSWQAVAA